MTPPTAARARPKLWLVRHGQTQWSDNGRHTGRTDLPLDTRGKQQAEGLRRLLAARPFARVLSSPLQRAVETCRLAGYGQQVEYVDTLVEWDYGDYEGITTEEVRRDRPGWLIWNDGVPNGETVEQVGKRADRLLQALADTDGDVALFGHGHMLRVLAARWLDLPAANGRLFALDAASVSRLDYEHDLPVIGQWNRLPAQE